MMVGIGPWELEKGTGGFADPLANAEAGRASRVTPEGQGRVVRNEVIMTWPEVLLHRLFFWKRVSRKRKSEDKDSVNFEK